MSLPHFLLQLKKVRLAISWRDGFFATLFAIWSGREEVCPPLPDHSGPPSSDHVYLATGFPASRSKAKPSSNRQKTTLSGFCATLASAGARDELLTHPKLQLVFSLNIDRMNFSDDTVKAIADPAGMSGSPIWLQQGDELKCAGILIEHHRSKKLLVATDIAVGLHLIEQVAARRRS